MTNCPAFNATIEGGATPAMAAQGISTPHMVARRRVKSLANQTAPRRQRRARPASGGDDSGPPDERKPVTADQRHRRRLSLYLFIFLGDQRDRPRRYAAANVEEQGARPKKEIDAAKLQEAAQGPARSRKISSASIRRRPRPAAASRQALARPRSSASRRRPHARSDVRHFPRVKIRAAVIET